MAEKIGALRSAYPKKIRLNVLGKDLKLNQWIDLNSMTQPKIKKLFEELIRAKMIIETSDGDQVIPAEIYFYSENGFKFVRVRPRSVDEKSTESPINIYDFYNRRFYKIKIIAAPTIDPPPIFLFQRNLDEEFLTTKLSVSDRTLIEKYSAGLVTFADFLQRKKFNRKGSANKNILLLGNDGFYYRKLAEMRGYEVFETIYSEFYKEGTLEEAEGPWDQDQGPRPDITHRFMMQISGYRKIFLIPANFPQQIKMYGGSGGYTWVEWQWLKDNPEEMKNTLFVVGVDRSIGPVQNVVHVHNETNSEHLPLLFGRPDFYLLK